MILTEIKCFCINLDRSEDRWERAHNNFSNIGQEIERFSAFEGSKLTKNDVPETWANLKFYGSGVAGCALSHYKLWEHILSTDLPYACILEDDASLIKIIDNIEIEDDNFDILYISDRIGSDSLGRASFGCGTESYIVSREGCKKLLLICEDMCRPVDLRIQAHIRGFIENSHFLCNGFSNTKYPYHSKKHDQIILEGYLTKEPFTKHEDYGISYVNNDNQMKEVEKVVYINLDHRTDRMESIENELRKVFTKDKIIRFSAIKDEVHGGIGCSKSHIAVLKMAIENDWKNVLIVEDDMVWKDKSGFCKVNKFLSSPYDVILLGGTDMKFNKERLIYAITATAYIVSNHYFKTLLQNYEESLENFVKTKLYNTYAIDQYWHKLQKQDNWRGVVPSLCVQTPSYSDIEKKNVNYIRRFD